jgi:mono/diheme cytochrome c family protein
VRPPRNSAFVAPLAALAAFVVTGCGAGTGGLIEAGDQTRGKELFQDKCAQCHVLADAGASGRVGPDLDAVFGANYQQGFAESTIRQVVADQIRYAGDYGTEGPTMPRDLVTGDDVGAVATYVAAKAGGGPEGAGVAGGTTTAPPTTTGPPPTGGGGGGGGGSTAAGKAAFETNGCGSCHTLAAAGSTGMVGPDLDKLNSYAKAAGKPLEDFIHESIVDPNAYVEKGFPQGVMPNFSTLPPATVDALVKFLASAAKS